MRFWHFIADEPCAMNMRRERLIAIATMGLKCLESNYGSFWQHYALRRKLKEWQFKTIRIQHPGDDASLFSFCWLIFRALGVVVRRMICRESGWRNQNAQTVAGILSALKFRREFRLLLGTLSGVRTGNAIAGIAGGDQVFWGKDPFMWLETLPSSCRRIAYSASTNWRGVTHDDKWINIARSALSKFYAIGLREQFGVIWYNKNRISGGLAVRVPDPVFLLSLEEWQSVMSPRQMFKTKTLLAYFVNAKKEEDLPLAALCELASARGAELRIIGIQGTALYVPKEYRLNVSPSEFLRCVHEAVAFVTNSFHGTAFAILFGKPFLSVQQESACLADQNLRQQELLEEFGFRQVPVASTRMGEFEKVDENDVTLSQWRDAGILFLKEALKDI